MLCRALIAPLDGYRRPWAWSLTPLYTLHVPIPHFTLGRQPANQPTRPAVTLGDMSLTGTGWRVSQIDGN